MKAKIIKCSQFDEIETNSFDGVENGYEEDIAVVEIETPKDDIEDKGDEKLDDEEEE